MQNLMYQHAPGKKRYNSESSLHIGADNIIHLYHIANLVLHKEYLIIQYTSVDSYVQKFATKLCISLPFKKLLQSV